MAYSSAGRGSTKGAYVPPHRRRRQSSRATSILEDDCLCIFCINLEKRPDKWRRFQDGASHVGDWFQRKVRRFPAIDGRQAEISEEDVLLEWDSSMDARYNSKVTPGKKTMSPGEVGCAMSHILLWRELVFMGEDKKTMFVLEDDAVFTTYRSKSRFAGAFEKTWKQLPEGWGICYLGFSSRGERLYVQDRTPSRQRNNQMDPVIELYRPEYGYHTHAYLITKTAAETLLENLPVVGPIDVWLADNKWFGLQVYCAVIANEGWQLDDGTYEGALLVSQAPKNKSNSDIEQSGRCLSEAKVTTGPSLPTETTTSKAE